MKKLVIIPAFNESGSILRAVQDIKEHAPGFDYVVINDCSTDDTLQVCQKNGLNHVNLSVNLGIGGAVQTGYLYGCQNHYDVAVQFDGDGQHDAAYAFEPHVLGDFYCVCTPGSDHFAAWANETAFQVFFTFHHGFAKKPAEFITFVRDELMVALYGNHALGRGSEKKNHVVYLRFYDLRFYD